ncbi:MAG: cyclopropane fatty-acyl-phospholipid synthase-like methyltransferase [Gammaproteobacteria bacterium]|jgi:cyclopropane fatty-acyl-phospholipid synthase-like methyltransferase
MKIDASTHHLIEPHNKAYNPVDKVFRMIMGDYASISNSWPGEYGAQTKENVLIAQQKKYAEYFKHLGLKENAGMKIFEIGPGWGPFSNYCIERGVDVTSVCPAKTQYEYLKKSGHNVHRAIWQEFTPENGPFDAVVAMGSPEHFVSPKDHLEGNQDKVYRQFFDYAHGLLKSGGRVGGQFMTFNGRELDYGKFQVDKDSKDDEESMYYHLGLLTYRYPDAWLPRDSAHFISCAKPGDYETVKVVDGREHYIWTARCWINTFNKARPFRKWFKVSGLVINSFFNKDFSYWAKAFYKQSNRLCFEKGWMGHEFFFVEKK